MHEIRKRILAWYKRNARDLPWRHTNDPYRIWVSEIMLQQTQVATVIGYFERFLAAFPNVRALADADEQDVLRLWSGLGYYRRARQMHAAAKMIASGAGQFPSELAEIQKLPGVGRYTAGAIASFAFDQPAPIVEANTQRLFSRLLRMETDPRSRDGQEQLWQFAESLLPALDPKSKQTKRKLSSGLINQALMELGSQLCTPREPNCQHCPLSSLCPTFAAGLQAGIPMLAPKKLITELTHVNFIIRNGAKLLLRQNTPSQDDWWHGLWDFPRVDITGREFHRSPLDGSELHGGQPRGDMKLTSERCEWLSNELHRQHQLDCTVNAHVSSLKHSVTRYRITLHSFSATPLNPTSRKPSLQNTIHRKLATLQRDTTKVRSAVNWFTIDSALELPLTSSAKRQLRRLALEF